MAEEHEARPDWLFAIRDGSAPSPEEAETTLGQARTAVEAFVKEVGISRDRARDVEAYMLLAHADAEPSVSGDHFGSRVDALERTVLGEQYRAPGPRVLPLSREQADEVTCVGAGVE